MFASLSGKVLKKLDRNIILEVNQVGYLINLPATTLGQIRENEDLKLFIHTQVREDDISLYGFLEFSDLEFFKLILSVSGIGPRLGMEIMSAPIAKIKKAILDQDANFLSAIPGIGKKTAERIILELKNKIVLTEIQGERLPRDFNQDVLEALVGMGYERHQVTRLLMEMKQEITTEEELLKYCLQRL